ncbi:hypothetical protein Tco_1550208 [Tanacetum coccineum]
MVGEEVPWPKEALVDWPSVQLIRMTVEEEEDWWFLERVVERNLELMDEPFVSRLEGIEFSRVEMRGED